MLYDISIKLDELKLDGFSILNSISRDLFELINNVEKINNLDDNPITTGMIFEKIKIQLRQDLKDI